MREKAAVRCRTNKWNCFSIVMGPLYKEIETKFRKSLEPDGFRVFCALIKNQVINKTRGCSKIYEKSVTKFIAFTTSRPNCSSAIPKSFHVQQQKEKWLRHGLELQMIRFHITVYSTEQWTNRQINLWGSVFMSLFVSCIFAAASVVSVHPVAFFLCTFSFTFMVDLIKALCFIVVVTSHLGWTRRRRRGGKSVRMEMMRKKRKQFELFLLTRKKKTGLLKLKGSLKILKNFFQRRELVRLYQFFFLCPTKSLH